MIRISKLTDYAIVLLCQMARAADRTHAATELAEQTGLATPTVSKLLKSLTRAGIISSSRGAHGGYAIAVPPTTLSIAQVIDALEGPIALTECSNEHDHCQQSASCDVRANWNVINRAVQTALDAVTLADMLIPPIASTKPETLLAFQPMSKFTLVSARNT